MHDSVPRIHAAGGELVIVGNGEPEHAQWFIEDFNIETPVYTNPDRTLYEALGAQRGLKVTRLPQLVWGALVAMRHGHRQTKTMGDSKQMGGTLVIASDGAVAYRYLSRDPSDNPPNEIPVAALERLTATGGQAG